MEDTRKFYDTTPKNPVAPARAFRVPHEPFCTRRDAILGMLLLSTGEVSARQVADQYWVSVQHANVILREMVEHGDLVVANHPPAARRPIYYRAHPSVLAQVSDDAGFEGVLVATHRVVVERLRQAWDYYLATRTGDTSQCQPT